MYQLYAYLSFFLLANVLYSAPYDGAPPSPPTQSGQSIKNVRPGAKFDQYRLSPNDLLHMQVFLEPDLEKEIRVEADGYVMLPLIGKIDVGGLTVIQAQEWIQTLYNADYLVDPQVSLLIIEFRQRRVQVMGQVNRPGPVEIPIGEEITLTEAIAAAGGFNLRAKKTEVQITRKGADGRTSDVLNYNVKDILENRKVKDPVLREGDTIFIRESVI